MRYVIVELFKFRADVPTPEYGTSMSTCFDLTFQPMTYSVKGFDYENDPVSRFCADDKLTIHPGDRLLIPTGLVMKIIDPTDQPLRRLSVRLHARSGLSYKKGLVLANAEGVVDVDYQQEIMVILTNITGKKQIIEKGERICQAEIVENIPMEFQIVSELPTQHSERNGGFGSTGST